MLNLFLLERVEINAAAKFEQVPSIGYMQKHKDEQFWTLVKHKGMSMQWVHCLLRLADPSCCDECSSQLDSRETKAEGGEPAEGIRESQKGPSSLPEDEAPARAVEESQQALF